MNEKKNLQIHVKRSTKSPPSFKRFLSLLFIDHPITKDLGCCSNGRFAITDLRDPPPPRLINSLDCTESQTNRLDSFLENDNTSAICWPVFQTRLNGEMSKNDRIDRFFASRIFLSVRFVWHRFSYRLGTD